MKHQFLLNFQLPAFLSVLNLGDLTCFIIQQADSGIDVTLHNITGRPDIFAATDKQKSILQTLQVTTSVVFITCVLASPENIAVTAQASEKPVLLKQVITSAAS